MLTIGQSISKSDLMARANAYQASVAADQGIPYQKAIRAENDCFTRMLKDAPGDSLADVKANALKSAAASTKKASLWTWGGYAAAAAILYAPLGLHGMAPMLGAFGVFIISQTVAARSASSAACQQKFASQLGEWQRSIDATASQPPAPAPPQPVICAQPPAQPAKA